MAPATRLRAVFYPVPWRVLAGALRAVSGATLLALLPVLLAPQGGPVNPLRLVRLVAGFCLVPELAALLIRRALAGHVRVEGDMLVLEQRRRRIEIPVGALAAVAPWLVPLPSSGVWLRLRSGRRWSEGLAMEDPLALLDALASAAPQLRGAARHPSLGHARARGGSEPRAWYRTVLDFPVFALVPTLPLFRVHQIIAYGSALGEYYQYGPTAYLVGFAIYWATLTIYLMVYAAALRVAAELVAAGAAVLAPRHATAVRRAVERLDAVLYYVGVPLAVALRFVPW